MEHHIVVVDQTVSLLRSLRDTWSNIDSDDKETLGSPSSAFIKQCFVRYAAMFSHRCLPRQW